MKRIIRRPKAKADLEEIFNWIADDSVEAADRYLEKLLAGFHTLADMPMIGSRRLPSYPDIRVFPVGNHLILYRILLDENCVEILRIVHGAQNWTQGIDLH